MFLESPQSGGAFAPGFPNDQPRGGNTTQQQPSQKEKNKKETEDEKERKKGKPVPGVDPVEPAGGGGGGTPSKEPNFPPLTLEVPAAPVPDSVVPAPTGGGTVGDGKVKLPTGETVELRNDNYGPEAPPLAGEELLPGQTDYTVVRPRSFWADTPWAYDFAYGPGRSEALATAAGVAQNLTTRPGPEGRVRAAGRNAGQKLGAAGYIAPAIAAAGTFARSVDTIKDNWSDPGDMIGELGDLWGHAFMDYFGYNAGKAIGGGLKAMKPRMTKSYPGDETPMSAARRDVASIEGRALPAIEYEPGTQRDSRPISHKQMIQAGAGPVTPKGTYSIPTKDVFTPGSAFRPREAPAGSFTTEPVFKPFPEYTGFNPVKGLHDNFKKIAIGLGIGGVGAATTWATNGAQSLTQMTGAQSQENETANMKVAGASPSNTSNLIGIEANDWYTRWLASRKTFGKAGSPIGGQGLDVEFKTPYQQDLMTAGPDSKWKVYPRQ
jgi:hypothetical protein